MNTPNPRPMKGEIQPPWQTAAAPANAPRPPWALDDDGVDDSQQELPGIPPADNAAATAPVALPTPPVQVAAKPVEARAKRERIEPVLPIVLEVGIELPPVAKPVKTCPYPFAVMQVGHSFFDAIPVKKMSPVVNKYVKSMSIEGADGKLQKTVQFEIRSAEKEVDGVVHQGCRVFRTA